MRPSYVFLGIPATQGNSKGEAQAWLPPLHQGSRVPFFLQKSKGILIACIWDGADIVSAHGAWMVGSRTLATGNASFSPRPGPKDQLMRSLVHPRHGVLKPCYSQENCPLWACLRTSVMGKSLSDTRIRSQVVSPTRAHPKSKVVMGNGVLPCSTLPR